MRPRRRTARLRLEEPAGLLEDERDEHVDLVASDPAVGDLGLLLLDPRGGDPPQRLGRPLDANLDGVFEAGVRLGADLGDPRNASGHPLPPDPIVVAALIYHCRVGTGKSGCIVIATRHCDASGSNGSAGMTPSEPTTSGVSAARSAAVDPALDPAPDSAAGAALPPMGSGAAPAAFAASSARDAVIRSTVSSKGSSPASRKSSSRSGVLIVSPLGGPKPWRGGSTPISAVLARTRRGCGVQPGGRTLPP